MSVIETIAKNTIFNFITNASDILINFGIGILLARFLGPEDYGLYTFLVWFLYFAILFTNLGLGYMTTRFIAEALGGQKTSDIRPLISVSLWLRIIAATLFTLIIIVFAGFWADLFGHSGNQQLFILLAIGILPQVVNFLLANIFAGFQRYEYGAYLMLCSNPLRALGIVIVCILGLGVREVVLSSIIAWIMGCGFGIFLLRRLVPLKNILSPPQISPELKRALKYAMSMTGVYFISYVMMQRAEILFLGIYHPGEQVGFYTIAFMIPASTMHLVLVVFSQVLVPAVSEQFGRGNIEKIRQIFVTSARYLMMLGLPLAIGGIALSGPILILLYGTEYISAIPVMQVLFIPLALMGIADAAAGIIYGMNQPSFIVKTGIFLVILSIGLELALIPPYGAMGAAIGSSIPRLVAPVLYISYASKKCQASWPIKDTFRITLAAIIMGGIIFVLQQYIKSPALSLVLLVPLGIVLHLTGLMVFGAVKTGDITVLKRIQNKIPAPLRGGYGTLVGMLGNMVKKNISKEFTA